MDVVRDQRRRERLVAYFVAVRPRFNTSGLVSSQSLLCPVHYSPERAMMSLAALCRRAASAPGRAQNSHGVQLRNFAFTAFRRGATPAGVVQDPMTGELTSLPDIEVRIQ